MASIRSECANFSVQAMDEEDPAEASVLVSAWTVLGENLQTKIGADFRLPPDKAIELAKQILKCAYALIPIEAPAAAEAA